MKAGDVVEIYPTAPTGKNNSIEPQVGLIFSTLSGEGTWFDVIMPDGKIAFLFHKNLKVIK